ncbi:ankyrin repeat-containing domain protein [Lactarius vividus]|nr:ankyrin repeat-containing domain protein [Lactarius vividus]
MAAAQLLKIAHNVENKITQVIGSSQRQELRRWVSPPDPSTNHNIACDASHKQTADWFFEGNKIKEWKSTGSLLWIHGKPGAGKSILCSSIIQDAFVLSEAGLISVAYFYFDFRDTDKQSRHDLLLSLVSQLSTRSDPCCEILSRLYVTHDNGARKPSDDVLVRCLKEMLTLLVQSPTYLIVDALDECPNTSGVPSARARVIELVKELLGLGLPNLRICITSRPEIDIKASLGPLASHLVSLHDEIGQKQDIADYIKSVVYSKSDAMMSRWREDEKTLVIETLSERADGMFRWVFCQLEALQGCLPASVRRTLKELPESLDETYERILKQIKRPSIHHAHRLLQCLTVAIRPLRVEELAELLAYDFDAAEEGIPKVDPNWRWKDHEEAVLSTCSSLIAVIDDSGSRVVQFSHFSVKEFLTSDRLATSSGDAAHYHISLVLAHTLLAQACLGTLISLDGEGSGSNSAIRDENSFPLASYAAQHWVAHSQVDKALSRVQGGMRQLFDPAKPHFAAWVRLYDVEDREWQQDLIMEPMATPLYYAALCGFHGLMEHLLIKYPEHVNALGGGRGAALHAASARNDVKIAQILVERGGDVNVRSLWKQWSPLHIVAIEGHVEMGRFLLDHGADVDSRTDDLWTPLHFATRNGLVGISQVLLEYKADVDSRSIDGRVPLHRVSQGWTKGDHPAIVRLLLEHGADVDVKDDKDATPLHLASSRGRTGIVRLLLEHGADVDAKDKQYMTPLHKASSRGSTGVVRLLLDHGANVDAEDEGRTPFQVASSSGNEDISQMLTENGAQLHE